MCGIIGFIGNKNKSMNVLIHGLKRLEYRGYDSAGVAILQDGSLDVYKQKGRISELERSLPKPLSPQIGIGHTRWATHGKPSRENAHPHVSQNKRFAIVHNGVIENDTHLKQTHLKNIPFQSDTDSESIVLLIEKFVTEEKCSVEDAFRRTLDLLEGSFAIAFIDQFTPDRIYAAKNKSPLLIGIGDESNIITSDAAAVISETNRFIEIKDYETVVVYSDRVEMKDKNNFAFKRECFTLDLEPGDVEKGHYPHYMLKEIEEQPEMIRNIVRRCKLEKEMLNKIKSSDRLYIVACGTSYHAGLIGQKYFEEIAGIPTEVHIASEFAYHMPLLSKNPFFIFLSQSGETADSRSVLANVKQLGHPSLAITNVSGSTLSRESDFTILLHAGPEIAVASTKAYTAQLTVQLLLSCALNPTKEFNAERQLGKAALVIESICDRKDEFENIAEKFLSGQRNAFYIGRGMDWSVGLEAALKLKEISYIQTEGYAAGELKHGPIALIEKDTPVFAIITQEKTNGNTRSNIKEVESRGANVCTISTEENSEKGDEVILPDVHSWISPIVSVVPTQYIAYYAALQRGCDIDKPKNLAKSVTVE